MPAKFKPVPPPTAATWKSSLALGIVCSAAAFWAGRLSTNWGGEKTATTTRSASKSAGAKRPGGSFSVTVPAEVVTLESLLEASGKPDADLVARWIRGLSADELHKALAQLQGMPGGLARDAVLGAVIKAWAAADPKAYLATRGTIANLRMRDDGATAALKALGASDPAAALAWIRGNPGDKPTNDRHAAAIIMGYVESDPNGALAFLTGLDDSTDLNRTLKRQGLTAWADTMGANGQFTDALAALNQQGGGPAVDDASRHVMDSWTSSDPAAAANWAAQMAAASANTPDVPGQPKADDLLAHAVGAWAASDMAAAAAFLNQLPDSAAKDKATGEFVAHASEQDPAGAFTWALAISSDPARQHALEQVADHWQQQDPNGFVQFLNTTSALTDAQKQQLASRGGRGAPPPPDRGGPPPPPRGEEPPPP